MDFTSMTVYLAVLSITPGPNNLMTMYLCANHGIKKARKFMLASMASYFVKMLLCGLLNVALAEAIPAAVPYLKWVGAAYMLYLAVHIFMDGFKNVPQQNASVSGESTYKSGILLQLLNIKSWVGGLTLYSIYVVPYTTSTLDVLTATLISSAAMIVSSLLWAVFGTAIRQVYNRHKKVCSTIMALSLVWCAVTALQ